VDGFGKAPELLPLKKRGLGVGMYTYIPGFVGCLKSDKLQGMKMLKIKYWFDLG
jgi:hypothetical protein